MEGHSPRLLVLTLLPCRLGAHGQGGLSRQALLDARTDAFKILAHSPT